MAKVAQNPLAGTVLPNSEAVAAASARSVYRHADLARVLSPQSVAIVGATPNPGALGGITLHNLARFDGRIHLVNPKYDRIGERRCHATVADLPEAPDCVVVAVGRDTLEGVVSECARAGAGGVLIYASGYAETGEAENIALQQRLTAIARETGLRIIGPNCVGVVNHLRGFGLSFAPDLEFSGQGEARIGLVSQSGGVGNGLTQALRHGTLFSHTLSAGNSCDVDINDYICYLADDPGCRAIALIFEGMAEPWRLIQAGEVAWAAGKPLVIFKLARGARGAVAALSHTGFLAGSSEAYSAAFERVGAVVVDSFHALIQTASFFAKAGAPKARGVAVLGSSGGNLVLAVDEAEAHGIALPQPGDATRDGLSAILPEFASSQNPCDITGGGSVGTQELLNDAASVLFRDSQYGALVYPWGYVSSQRIGIFTKLSELARGCGKPALVVCTSEWLEGPGSVDVERNPHLCLFRSMEFCMAALAAWHAREDRRHRSAGEARPPRVSSEGASAAAAKLLDSVPGASLSEREAKAVLAAYGIAGVEERLVQSADAAAAAAIALGLPVALKIESIDIAHKSEADAVRLNLKSADEVRAAYAEVSKNAARANPNARINGVLVQPMVTGGVEMLVGARIDRQFGPLIVVGLGGIFVELLQDRAVALAPVTIGEAKEMLDRLRGQALLRGFRGSAAVDLDALAAVIVRISELAADHAGHIAELDVNPLICKADRITAVDALIVKARGKRRGVGA